MSKRTKLTKQKNLQRMPAWIRSNDYRLINRAEKDLLAYIYRFESDAGRLRSCQLAKTFYVTRRTIQLWLKKLRYRKFIRIENPGTIHRLIHLTGTDKFPEKQLTA